MKFENTLKRTALLAALSLSVFVQAEHEEGHSEGTEAGDEVVVDDTTGEGEEESLVEEVLEVILTEEQLAEVARVETLLEMRTWILGELSELTAAQGLSEQAVAQVNRDIYRAFNDEDSEAMQLLVDHLSEVRENGTATIGALIFDPSRMKTSEDAFQESACEYKQTKSDLIQFCGGNRNQSVLRVVPKNQDIANLENPFVNIIRDYQGTFTTTRKMITKAPYLDGGFFYDDES